MMTIIPQITTLIHTTTIMCSSSSSTCMYVLVLVLVLVVEVFYVLVVHGVRARLDQAVAKLHLTTPELDDYIIVCYIILHYIILYSIIL